MANNNIRQPNGNGKVVDPSENVKALNDAAQQRQDDLRLETNKRLDGEVVHLKETGTLRSEHSKHMAELRSGYERQLADAEAKRIDAIRAVDVNAVAVASERQAAAATVLANQVSQSADALRTLVSTTATAIAGQAAEQRKGDLERIAALERSSYEGVGKQRVADPMLTEMVAEMKSLREARAGSQGKSVGMNAGWLVLIGAVGLFASILTIAGVLYAVLKN